MTLSVSCILNAAEPNKASDKLFQYLNQQEYAISDINIIAEALGFQNWPQTNVWRVAPDINTAMLLHPEKISWENKHYDVSYLFKEPWGCCSWSLMNYTDTRKELPTELPEKLKNNLVQALTPEYKKDPNLVKAYLNESLEGYRHTLSCLKGGRLHVEIGITPNSRAAHEALLSYTSNSNMGYQGIIAIFKCAEKLNDLGTMNYVMESNGVYDEYPETYVYFVRDNIIVYIRGEGNLADETLHLARKIDSAIVKSPALTYEQLISRQPSFIISSEITKKPASFMEYISYSFSAPNNVNIVATKQMDDSRFYDIRDDKIILQDTSRPFDIKLIAITNELLVGKCEKTLEIREEANEVLIHDLN
jgi:hypothetical protein